MPDKTMCLQPWVFSFSIYTPYCYSPLNSLSGTFTKIKEEGSTWHFLLYRKLGLASRRHQRSYIRKKVSSSHWKAAFSVCCCSTDQQQRHRWTAEGTLTLPKQLTLYRACLEAVQTLPRLSDHLTLVLNLPWPIWPLRFVSWTLEIHSIFQAS